MREVLVFRQNLFRKSEIFIRQQAESLSRYRPLYMGRRLFSPPPPDYETLTLDTADRSWLGRKTVELWQMLSRDPGPFSRQLGTRRPALVHAHFGIDGVQILPTTRRLSLPLVTTFHGFDATLATSAFLRSPAWFNYPLFRRTLAKQGALFLCASDFILGRVLAMGFPASRTRRHYIGVDCARIQPRRDEDEKTVVLHVARLVEVKGTEYLIRAFARVAPSRPEWRLVIIGEGPLRERLMQLARTCGVGTQVDFLGVLPHETVIKYMRRSAMLVLPSVHAADGREEGLGMVLLEAEATGLPVIGSRSGGIPEGILDDVSGLLVPERDTDALATALDRLMDDRQRRLDMGRHARSFVARQFDRVRQAALLEMLYDDVVAAHSSRQVPSA